MIPAIAPSGPNKTAAVMPGIADSRLFDRGHAPLAASIYVTREQAMDPKEHDKKRTPKNSKNIFQNETNIAAIAIQTTMTVHRRYFISVPRPPQLAASFILGRIATLSNNGRARVSSIEDVRDQASLQNHHTAS